MTDKPTPKTKRDPNRIAPAIKPEEGEALGYARTFMRPTVQAAVTLQEYGKQFGDLDLIALINSLTEQTKAVNAGDLNRPEAMLTAQAHTLDAIFNNLARRAALNMGTYLQTCQIYLKLALRAQAQCRATVETLAELKQPRSIAYVTQANIAHGHQQVNNTPSCADEIENTHSKLLGENYGQRLDTGTTSAAVGTDQGVETVETVQRPKNG